jgi:hypothetical protein
VFWGGGALRCLACSESPSQKQNKKWDVENTFQVLAELKKQQREAPFKVPQMDAPVQHTVLAECPATNPADAHSLKKFGLHQPRPSPGSPSSVTGSSTTATTPRPPACHALGDLHGQDSVRKLSSDGFDGMYNEGDSDGLGCYPPPLPSGVVLWGPLAPLLYINKNL